MQLPCREKPRAMGLVVMLALGPTAGLAVRQLHVSRADAGHWQP